MGGCGPPMGMMVHQFPFNTLNDQFSNGDKYEQELGLTRTIIELHSCLRALASCSIIVACVKGMSRSYLFISCLVAVGQRRPFHEVAADLARVREIAGLERRQLEFDHAVVHRFWTAGRYRAHGLLTPILPPRIDGWVVSEAREEDEWVPYPGGFTVTPYKERGIPFVVRSKRHQPQ